jgi:hypothetical protein
MLAFRYVKKLHKTLKIKNLLKILTLCRTKNVIEIAKIDVTCI